MHLIHFPAAVLLSIVVTGGVAGCSTGDDGPPPVPRRAASAPAGDVPAGPRALDVDFEASPQPVVERMLELADVKKGDVVYDLGCGDGRIVVAAAKLHGAKAVGVEIDPERVREARENVRKNGVEHLVRIEQADMFTLDLSGADVVALYLGPELNDRLVPQLEKLKPGSRIVSHQSDIQGAPPSKVISMTVAGEREPKRDLYLWIAPIQRDPTAHPRPLRSRAVIAPNAQ